MFDQCLGHRSFNITISALLITFLLSFYSSGSEAATSCGGDGERACCIASTERDGVGACKSPNIELPGCTAANQTDCTCGGSGLAVFFGSSSSSHCQKPNTCGHEGERACCLGEDRWGSNPVPTSAGCEGTPDGGLTNLTEMAGNVPEPAVCGGWNPFGHKSNGHCVLCGSEGAHKCEGESITKDNECMDGLTGDAFGFCTKCGGEGQVICRSDTEDWMCNRGYHPDGGECTADKIIAEPDCDCTPAPPSNDPTIPVNGYADLHLHMFANLGFGGLTVWGDAFNVIGGISQALRADNYAQRTADYIINDHVKQGINGDIVPIDFFRRQQLIHGDLHFNDIIGGGTNQQAALGVAFFDLSNGGVQWDITENHFLGWPRWNSTTHQQSYYKWLERAHRGGLQLTVLFAVTNETMCIAGRYLDYPEFDCAESKSAIDMQLAKAFELEDWLNTKCQKAADPDIGAEEAAELLTACATPDSSEGWFKVVTSPQEARNAIAKGQLAVVLGIEEANLFNCNEGQCDAEYVQGQVDEYYDKGVRHIFPIHNFDNDYGGAATWMDTIGVGNNYATGEWYETENCPDTTASIGEDGFGFKLGGEDGKIGFSEWLSSHILDADSSFPDEYQDVTTSCNQKGLTALGKNLVQHLMSKGMIVDIDHMSVKAIEDTLNIAEVNAYPGIVASHALMSDLTQKEYRHERMRTTVQLQRIAALGGMIGAMTQPPEGGDPPTWRDHPVTIQEWSKSKVTNDCQASSKTWAQMYEWAVDVMQRPVAFGSDFNGISRHNAPRFGGNACDEQIAAAQQDETTRVTYPFIMDGFGEFDVQETGGRDFDYNEAGLAHVGLLPDMIQDLKMVGLTDEDLEPLFESAEAYISMWEGSLDVAENIDSPSTNDVTAPVVSLSLLPVANTNGWHNSAATATISAVDEIGGSGVTSIFHKKDSDLSYSQEAGSSHDIVFDTEGEYLLYYTARDLAGNLPATQNKSINLDYTNPGIVASVMPAANAAGWNNSDVMVSFGCTDSLSGIASCGPNQSMVEGSNQSVTGNAVDNAGNSASTMVNGINVDKTPPVVSVTGISDGESFIIGVTLPATGCDTTDALSGVATESVASISGGSPVNGVGEFTVDCSGATDVAGNVGQASIVYYVRFAFGGFQKPIDSPPMAKHVKAGQTIPVKFSLDGNYGLGILAMGSPTSSSISCAFTGAESDVKPTLATNSNILSYDEISDTYMYRWKTEKSWKNSCRLLHVMLEDGTTHTAAFIFK